MTIIKFVLAVLMAVTTWAAAKAPDMDGRQCFEDEAVVVVMQTWTGTHHEAANVTGNLACVPVDDMRLIQP